MTIGRDLTPRTDGVRCKLLSLYVTQEKWAWVDKQARTLRTSKSEVLRTLLNAGQQAIIQRKRLP